jgi:cytoskeletal protein RodZ
MSPWLTFVVGIIVGLLVGWLIDMLYRRAPRPAAEEQPDRTPDWAQPLPVATPAPELPGVALASTAAIGAVSEDEGLDVPPGSETGEVVDEVEWREIAGRVDEVAAAIDAEAVVTARVPSEMPEETGLPPSAAETLSPSTAEDDQQTGR